LRNSLSSTTLRHARYVHREMLANGIYLAKLRLVEPFESYPSPAQFVMVWVPGVKEMPMSISHYSCDGELTIVFRVRGVGTQKLASIGIGSVLGIRGPLGKGIAIRPEWKRVAILAGGIGIAPTPLLVSALTVHGCETHLFWGAKTRSELFDLDKIFVDKPDRIEISTDDGSYGFRGTVLELFKSVANVHSYDAVIAIGPNPMLRAVCEDMELKRIDPMVVMETIVKCGRGICGSCYIRGSTKLLCIDGPAFRCSEVMHHLRSLD